MPQQSGRWVENKIVTFIFINLPAKSYSNILMIANSFDVRRICHLGI